MPWKGVTRPTDIWFADEALKEPGRRRVASATDRVLGVHMIGPNVGDMIAEYCLGMELSATTEDVARTCHPHPTRSEALRQAAMAADGWAMQG